jgi:hypothetical protein
MTDTGNPPSGHEPVPQRRDRERTTQLALLPCGIIAPLLYIATDVIAAMQWEGYSFRDQTISELNANGSPTRPLTIALGLGGYTLLIGFGVGVWKSARENSRLRVVGGTLAHLRLRLSAMAGGTRYRSCSSAAPRDKEWRHTGR